MFNNCLFVRQSASWSVRFLGNQFLWILSCINKKKLHETKSFWIVQDLKIPKFNFAAAQIKKLKNQKFDYLSHKILIITGFLRASQIN